MRPILTAFLLFMAGVSSGQGFPAPTETKRDGDPVTVGTVFSPFEPMVATGVMFYRFSQWTGSTRVAIWDAVTGTRIAEGTAPAGATGWVEVAVEPKALLNDGDYVVGYSNADGWYSFIPGYFPRTFADYETPGGRYLYQDFTFPTLRYQQNSYSVFPILSKEAAPDPCQPVVIRDTMRIILRDTVYIQQPADTVYAVIYMEGRDTLIVDRNSNYTDSALQTWPFQGIWNYEFSVGAERFRFIRAFVWRREKWDGQAWRPED